VVLSDRDIRAAIAEGRIGIEPFDERCVQPASVDIRLDHRFRVFRSSRHAFIDLARPLDDVTELVEVPTRTPFILHPGEFVLGSTRERLRLPNDIVSRVEGKSSLGRLGLLIWARRTRVRPVPRRHATGSICPDAGAVRLRVHQRGRRRADARDLRARGRLVGADAAPAA
jgi:dCTP deaminase